MKYANMTPGSTQLVKHCSVKNCIHPTPSAFVNPLPFQLISQLSQSLVLLIVLTFTNHINKDQTNGQRK